MKGEEEPVLPSICTEATADGYSRAEGTSLLGCGRKPKLALLAIECIRFKKETQDGNMPPAYGA